MPQLIFGTSLLWNVANAFVAIGKSIPKYLPGDRMELSQIFDGHQVKVGEELRNYHRGHPKFLPASAVWRSVFLRHFLLTFRNSHIQNL